MAVKLFICIVSLIVFSVPQSLAKGADSNLKHTGGDKGRAPILSKNAKAAQLFKEGNALHSRGRYAESIELFKEATVIDPKFGDAYLHIGYAYYDLNQPEKVLAAINKAIRLNPSDITYLGLRQKTYFGLERFQDALYDCNKILSIDPTIENVYTDRAIIYEHLGRYADAVNDYNNYLKYDPGYDTLFSSRAKDYVKLGKYQLAIDDYSRMINRNPLDDLAIIARADLFMKVGKYEQAVQDYTKAIEFDPDDPKRVYEQRALAYEKLGKLDLAKSDREKAQRLARTLYSR